MTKFSLCLLVRKDLLQRYLILHPIIEDRLYHLVSKLRALLIHVAIEVNLSLNIFRTLLQRCKPQLYKSSSCFLLSKLYPIVSYFSLLRYIYSSSLANVKFTQTALFEKPAAIEQDFLARAITSHLQTHGCTVVVGENKDLVNLVLNFYYMVSHYLVY